MIKDKKNFWFLLTIFVIGLVTAGGYGVYLDQSLEQEILYMNFKEYLLHLPGDFSNLISQFTSAGIPEISKSIEMDHGCAVFYPLFPLWFLEKVSPFACLIIRYIYTFLITFSGVCSLYFLGESLFKSKRCAMVMSLLFFLSPRMFAELHYNNKDVVLLSLCFSLFYFGWKLREELTFKNVFMLAFVGAFAANTKVIGGFFFGMTGLFVLLHYLLNRKCTVKVWRNVALCIFLFFVIFIAITPACWNDIIGYFVSMFTSLSLSICFYLVAIVTLISLRYHEKLMEKNRYMNLFLWIGMAVAYFDFLTYPLVTLAFPLIVALYLDREEWKAKLKKMFCYSIQWGMGYIGLWSMKWILSDLLTDSHVIGDAISTVFERTQTASGGNKLTGLFTVLGQNLEVYFNWSFYILAFFVIIFLLYHIVKNKKAYRDFEVLKERLVILSVSLMPIIWYFLTQNHSEEHYMFTCKNIAIIVFAAISAITYRTEE